MEEQIQREQDLSEEQLQTISGGCATCNNMLDVIEVKQGVLNEHTKAADEARTRGDLDAAQGHLTAATTHLDAINNAYKSLKAKGHLKGL